MSDGQRFLDYYKLLGVSTNADAVTIRRAFIARAKDHHPDVGGSTVLMQHFTRAYRTLANETSRKAYDLIHAFHTGTSDLQYREAATDSNGTAANNLTDDEIDNFLDEIYAEYRNRSQSNQSLLSRIRSIF